MFLSLQTCEGFKIAVHSHVEATQFLFAEGFEYVLSERSIAAQRDIAPVVRGNVGGWYEKRKWYKVSEGTSKEAGKIIKPSVGLWIWQIPAEGLVIICGIYGVG